VLVIDTSHAQRESRTIPALPNAREAERSMRLNRV
jgi:hypothetical protein